MKTIYLFIILGFISVNSLIAQTKEQRKEKQRIEKFKKSIYELEIYKQIEGSKEQCERLLSRIKESSELRKDSALRMQYIETRRAFDLVIDAMQKDVNSVTTIGGLVEVLIERKEARERYSVLLVAASLKEEIFVENAKGKLHDDKWIRIPIDWAIGFLPGIVKKISDKSLSIITKILNNRLELLRFEHWDK